MAWRSESTTEGKSSLSPNEARRYRRRLRLCPPRRPSRTGFPVFPGVKQYLRQQKRDVPDRFQGRRRNLCRLYRQADALQKSLARLAQAHPIGFGTSENRSSVNAGSCLSRQGQFDTADRKGRSCRAERWFPWPETLLRYSFRRKYTSPPMPVP